ncbi:SixA phosphatase family protein [Tropicibacter naphthalenivorans]|uniref:Phosphoglyceromutase n=1 Tax=Tropicibacter naphthalenivorans TaxID=441103 RepID=A0A0N7LZW6_9RHOB|nr:histidine phosphatase family protein [Tropicibacter naphthalenivorans]CUH78809.1 phosphoglyceromutase [Tropicibacter naphthalenivorans]SMC81622.1 phosphohistidine phosphatase [Tropicibacter naphthalenivorans]
MTRLILMRHAKSDWSAFQDDHARGLNKRGRKSAVAMGDWLRTRGYLPDAILCSTATRTRETLDGLTLGAPVTFLDSLYHAAPDTMLDDLRGATGDTVLMIGHNPGISALAKALVRQPPDHARFADYPTCATLVVDFDSPWPDIRLATGEVQDFAVPREVIG